MNNIAPYTYKLESIRVFSRIDEIKLKIQNLKLSKIKKL